MDRTPFTVPTPSGHLGGWRAGAGAPVLLLHGGPGLSYGHLDPLAEELAAGYEVAFFQQRGLEPSTTEGPFTVAQAVADIASVLDGLGWERAWLVGHSWGGHLAFHAASSLPERLLGVLSIDPLGAVGDGGAEAFGAEMIRRVPEHLQARAQELDDKDTDGTASDADEQEMLDIVWPSYFATPAAATPRPPLAVSSAAHLGLWEDLVVQLPRLEKALASITVPVGVLAGAESPMPPTEAAQTTADRIPDAWAHLEPGVGHFVWLERPGCALAALDRLAQGTPET
ncbi:alpha/beta fold hydrolase [Pedococcus bigeumensis]|uniref:Alpha/beta hydrolase n=1 Tax=Pedococcus bigeumensis TaxID=433644 RepID=A0A502CTQ3_9MICO|nr:alpha/beta hydrolase [Pedococcus bigeumensis]TPG16213.1 alpha/beta hydrolase [Pedococcus bigeumensis]